jgi:hypothetical protein
MKRFKSARHLQQLVSVHDPIANLVPVPATIFHPPHRPLRAAALDTWRESARLNLTPRSCFQSAKFMVALLPFPSTLHGRRKIHG